MSLPHHRYRRITVGQVRTLILLGVLLFWTAVAKWLFY
jgi:hypothetical protein